MKEGRAKRRCPRIPVYLDIRVDLKDGSAVKGKVINLSTEGICIKTDDPIFAKEEISTEFLLPDTLSSVRVGGEVVWYRFDKKAAAKKERVHFSGVRFLDLGESYKNLIRYYTLKMLHDVEMVREQGIERVLNDVLILFQKGLITEKRMKNF
ncbi:MAG: PilZ domain-containing protein [Deltaproteobacteria bacterium]